MKKYAIIKIVDREDDVAKMLCDGIYDSIEECSEKIEGILDGEILADLWEGDLASTCTMDCYTAYYYRLYPDEDRFNEPQRHPDVYIKVVEVDSDTANAIAAIL